MKVGLFRPITVWPFPEERLAELAEKSGKLMSCEMNEGQLQFICKAATGKYADVFAVTQNNGKIITDSTILEKIREVL